MDPIVPNPSYPPADEILSERQKRVVFNFTFVKWAAEIAHFGVIKNNGNANKEEAFRNWNVIFPNTNFDISYDGFLGFLHCDQSLGQQIAQKFKSEFFAPDKRHAKPLILNQILQLSFSFAVRILLSVIYEEFFTIHHGIGSFGRWFDSHLRLEYKKFADFVQKHSRLCGCKDVHKLHHYCTIDEENTPTDGSAQLELELFRQEPLWNYAEVIGIDTNECKTVLQFCDDLRNIVHSLLASPSEKQRTTIKYFQKLNEFELLMSFLTTHEFYWYESSAEQLQNAANNIEKSGTLAQQKRALRKLLALLDKLRTAYGQANECELRSGKIKGLTKWGNSIFKFGQILFETFKNQSDEVNYDEMHQLLTIPLPFVQHFLHRLGTFVER
ncbi:hypothetical protein niasHS_001790 [Heterodera schachtii]|uniref:Uncharacterized protein n=1 Tax=Heterodera schachtii TaxID=97005 RepID=A0ABD2KBE7_HETSC